MNSACESIKLSLQKTLILIGEMLILNLKDNFWLFFITASMETTIPFEFRKLVDLKIQCFNSIDISYITCHNLYEYLDDFTSTT